LLLLWDGDLWCYLPVSIYLLSGSTPSIIQLACAQKMIHLLMQLLFIYSSQSKQSATNTSSGACLRAMFQLGFGYSGHGPSFDPTGEGEDKDTKLLHTECTKQPLPDDFDDDDLS
jgi:hypothetical protein